MPLEKISQDPATVAQTANVIINRLTAENERLRNAVEIAEKVFSKLERGAMPSVSYGEVISLLRGALTHRPQGS